MKQPCRGTAAARQMIQFVDNGGVISIAFLLSCFQGGEDLSDCIDRTEQGRGNLGIENQFARPQAAQQVFRCMADGLELDKIEEPRGALDGVEGPEDPSESPAVPERFALGRLLFQGHEVEVKLCEVLVCFE